MKGANRQLKALIPASLKQPVRRLTGRWHRAAVGGMWEEIGRLQYDFLVEQGLSPDSYLLDVGCGSLRGGILFIRHLKVGHYFGVDADREILKFGRDELRKESLEWKNPTLLSIDDFGFDRLGRKFDFALAQSVFTHLPLNSIFRCLLNIEDALLPGGRFYATFFENPYGKRNQEPIAQPQSDGSTLITFPDKDPYHYDFGVFEWACEGRALEAEYLGDWGHPRNQKMMVFVKTGGSSVSS